MPFFNLRWLSQLWRQLESLHIIFFALGATVFSKFDMKTAYKNIPQHPSVWPSQAMFWLKQIFYRHFYGIRFQSCAFSIWRLCIYSTVFSWIFEPSKSVRYSQAIRWLNCSQPCVVWRLSIILSILRTPHMAWFLAFILIPILWLGLYTVKTRWSWTLCYSGVVQIARNLVHIVA
jgi:hypothetical protein